MYSILIMEEKAEKPTKKKTAHTGLKQWQCPYAVLGYGSATRRGIPDQRNTTTLIMY